ncbi:MAG: glutaredoxin family protein [Anaerolineae bacterium]|nr:glutaredoxin family protein [Anaerolineae bacterium]
MDKELIMYSRSSGCPMMTLAKRVLDDYQVPYREIFIDHDKVARQRVEEWTGFLSVPTLVIANKGEIVPYEAPAYLPKGDTPRGVNRGAMITEPNIRELTEWLIQHQFITAPSEA